MGIQEEGIEMEQWLLSYYREKDIEVFQPDAISFEDGKFVLNEIKHQEYFKSPPFDGHGLSRWQVIARMKFFLITNIRCKFIVKEKNLDVVYWQWLDVLESGEFYDTFGVKPRRIYPIKSFNKKLP